MAKTIGAVEFKVDFDGKKLPAEARRMAKEIGAAGDEAGKEYGKKFESSADKSLSQVGKRVEDRLGRTGKLAGTTFSNDFNDAVKGKFRAMQSNLANVLSDPAAFREFASGFDSVDDAVKQLHTDLEAVNKQNVEYTDSQGKLRQRMALTNTELERFSNAAERMGVELEKTLAKEKAFADEQDRLAKKFELLMRSVGTVDGFRELKKEAGSSALAVRMLNREVDALGGQFSGDTLDQFRNKLRETRTEVDKLDKDTERLSKKPSLLKRAFTGLGDSIRNGFQGMDDTVKLVIVLIAGAATEIASLGSTMGAGIISLGTAVAELGVAALAVYSIFSTLNSKTALFTGTAATVKKEFTGLKDALSTAKFSVANAAISHMSGVFAGLATTVTSLSPALDRVGASVGRVSQQFEGSLQPGTAAFNQLQILIDNTARDLPKVAAAAGTMGLALLRAINRANPLFIQFVGWVQRLGTQFDDFTKSNNFGAWVAQASTSFTHLGGLIDSLGRTLNNLSTPKAAVQVNAFLDSLTRLVPVLGQVLQVIGNLGPLGLIAQLLDDLGSAITPLIGPLGQLATSLNTALQPAIAGFASALTAVLPVVSAVTTVLADFISVVPAPVWQAVGAGMLLVASGMAAIAAVKGISAAATSMSDLAKDGSAVVALFKDIKAEQGVGAAIKGIGLELTGLSGAFGKAKSAGSGFMSSISTLGKAGIFGAAIAGAVTLGAELAKLPALLGDYAGKATEAVGANKGLVDSYKQVFGVFSSSAGAFSKNAGALTSTTLNVNNLHQALVRMSQENANGGEFFAAWKIGASQFGDAAHDLRSTLSELDAPIAAVAATNLSAASAQFSAYAAEAGASGKQINALIDGMPQFKQALTEQAQSMGLVATDANLAQLAMQGQTNAQKQAADAANQQAEQMRLLSGQTAGVTKATDDAASAITDLGNVMLASRDKSRALEQAIDAGAQAVKSNSAALNKAKTDFDITTAAGQKNQAAMDAIASAAIAAASAIYKQTGSQKDATDAIQRGRDSLIKQLEAFGMSENAARHYADQLKLNPKNLSTVINVSEKGADAVEKQVNYVARDRDAWVNVNFNMSAAKKAGITNGSALFGGANARGAIATAPTFGMYGEAGPEAIVPLRRNLSQVDPSVRALSAFAQGLSMPGGSGPSTVTGSDNGFTVAPGAIQIIGAEDPRRTAIEVLDYLVESMS